MKTSLIKTLAQIIGVTIALALFTSFTPQIGAGETGSTKGATKLLQLNQDARTHHEKTAQSAKPKATKAGAAAPACAKCITATVARPSHPFHQGGMVLVRERKHLCGSCLTAFDLKKWKTVHTCKESASCCPI
ncbi:MAG: hypothetical protein AAB676_04910 [Verrucomicrobiota bacterium]